MRSPVLLRPCAQPSSSALQLEFDLILLLQLQAKPPDMAIARHVPNVQDMLDISRNCFWPPQLLRPRLSPPPIPRPFQISDLKPRVAGTSNAQKSISSSSITMLLIYNSRM